ncbi:MAG: DEAD/DEAH box helicase [Pseudobdellovibrionaceae bacterium]
MKFHKSTLRTNNFSEMALQTSLLQAIESMKVHKPTDVQACAIPEILKGSDLIAVAQTGSGKTLAYALPILTAMSTTHPQGRALILVPSREMAQQTVKVLDVLCKDLTISSCLVIGGIPNAKQISALKKNPRLIVATPGRLNDHLLSNKLLLQNLSHIVIDEADRMLDMGFLPQLQNIKKTLRGQQQTLMFSASFNPAIESVAQIFMNQSPVMIRTETAEKPVNSLKQKVLFIDRAKKDDRLLDELNAAQGSVIVFCSNQESCEKTGQYLKDYGYKTDLIHGALSQGQRNRVVREFREEKLRVLVATDLLARGLDVPHVDHVINFELPFDAEDFLHRIGRTARAGRNGQAITFVTTSDGKKYQKIKKYLVGAEEVQLEKNFAFAFQPRTAYSKPTGEHRKPASSKSSGGPGHGAGSKSAGGSRQNPDSAKKQGPAPRSRR